MEPNKYVDCLLLMTTALTTNADYQKNSFDGNVKINVSIVLNELRMIDAKNMLMEIDGLIVEEWYDPLLGVDEHLTRRKATKGQIWNPKIVNINGLNVLDETTKKETLFWRGYGHEGHVFYIEKFLINFHCMNDLKRFPFDANDCLLKFGSYRFPSYEVDLIWKDVVLQIDLKRELDGFHVLEYAKSVEIEVIPQVGNFTRLVFNLRIHRNSLRYVFCTIVPSILTILLDYLTLWLDFDDKVKQTRLSVNLLTFTYLLYVYYETICSETLMIVNYLKLLDVFLMISLTFAATSLLESCFQDARIRKYVCHDTLLRTFYFATYVLLIMVLFYLYLV